MVQATARQRWAFGAWALVGALACLGVLAILSIGVFLLVAGALVTVLVLRRLSDVPAGVAGLAAGAALPVAWVGWLNRHGPGEVCTTSATATTCGEEWAPWPWFAVAVCLLVAGVVVFGLLVRRGARS